MFSVLSVQIVQAFFEFIDFSLVLGRVIDGVIQLSLQVIDCFIVFVFFFHYVKRFDLYLEFANFFLVESGVLQNLLPVSLLAFVEQIDF